MQCPKCRGLMVPETILVADEAEWLRVDKCVNCGEILDPEIMKHRNYIAMEDPFDGETIYAPVH